MRICIVDLSSILYNLSHSFDKILGVEHCSATTGGVLDRAIDAEDEEHQDFLRLVRPNFDC